LKSKRHVNLPGVRVNLPAITQKDTRDILFGLNDGTHALSSCVRQGYPAIKTLMGEKVGKVKIIAKIEDQKGSEPEEIIKESTALWSRGDLGVGDQHGRPAECPAHDRVNVRRVRKTRDRGNPSTQSMIHNPHPTRAEVSDVANAIYEEADAVMLSGETTVGKYPVKCVEYLRKIALKSETIPGLQFAKHLRDAGNKQQLAVAAVQLAEGVKAKGIVVITRRGLMADLVANCRPFSNIYAFTNMSNRDGP
jgi:pyruvate kinase